MVKQVSATVDRLERDERLDERVVGIRKRHVDAAKSWDTKIEDSGVGRQVRRSAFRNARRGSRLPVVWSKHEC